MTPSAKTVPGASDHDICMIAPTVPGCKGPMKALGDPARLADRLRFMTHATVELLSGKPSRDR